MATISFKNECLVTSHHSLWFSYRNSVCLIVSSRRGGTRRAKELPPPLSCAAGRGGGRRSFLHGVCEDEGRSVVVNSSGRRRGPNWLLAETLMTSVHHQDHNHRKTKTVVRGNTDEPQQQQKKTKPKPRHRETNTPDVLSKTRMRMRAIWTRMIKDYMSLSFCSISLLCWPYYAKV